MNDFTPTELAFMEYLKSLTTPQPKNKFSLWLAAKQREYREQFK